MTSDEWERRCEQMDDTAARVRAEHLKTGRNVREILNAMRDEGYIECTDQALEECAKIAEYENDD